MQRKASVVIALSAAGLVGCSSSSYQQTPSNLGSYEIVSCADQASAYTTFAKLIYNFTNTSSGLETVVPVVYADHTPISSSQHVYWLQSSGAPNPDLAFTVGAGQTVSQTLSINAGISDFCESDPALDVIAATSVTASSQGYSSGLGD